MLISETTIRTDRPTRYLTQLCRHAGAMARQGNGPGFPGHDRAAHGRADRAPGHRPHDDQEPVEHDDAGHEPEGHGRAGHGPGGRGLGGGDLQVHAEYGDDQGVITFTPWGRCVLNAAEDRLTVRAEAVDGPALARIQGIVTRDLERFGRRDEVTLTWPPARPAGPGGEARPDTRRTTGGRRSRRTVILLAALIVVAVAIHLGLLGALSASRWAGVSIDVIVVAVAAKIVVAVFGGRALRRRHLPHRFFARRARTTASGADHSR